MGRCEASTYIQGVQKKFPIDFFECFSAMFRCSLHSKHLIFFLNALASFESMLESHSVSDISGIPWAFFGHFLGISWAYLGYISGIYQEYLGHIPGIS